MLSSVFFSVPLFPLHPLSVCLTRSLSLSISLSLSHSLSLNKHTIPSCLRLSFALSRSLCVSFSAFISYFLCLSPHCSYEQCSDSETGGERGGETCRCLYLLNLHWCRIRIPLKTYISI